MSAGRPHAISESRSTNISRNASQYSSTSPMSERRPSELGLNTSARRAPPVSDPVVTPLDITARLPGILLRKLPRSVGHDSLISMLLFATDLLAVDFIDSTPEDAGFATAIAQFRTSESATEAMDRLNNKPNSSSDANMIVEAFCSVLASSSLGRRVTMRRTMLDNSLSRQTTHSASSAGSRPDLSRQSSHFNNSFKSLDDRTMSTSHNTDFSNPDAKPRLDHIFAPRSPVGNRNTDRAQNSGKAFINDDADDETGELLKDPLAYARNDYRKGYSNSPNAMASASVQFGNLSLNPVAFSSSQSAPASSLSSPLPTPHSSGPGVPPGTGPGIAPRNPAFRTSPQKLSFPAANPADQNPPCNTLYVGNLPVDTNEDELKRIFCQQRGYKRLSFRMKQNGPMCFVEFESITFATQALSLLYGTLLSNSVKGGIRLSFSKNPLGVRSGQTPMPGGAAMGPPGMSGYGNGVNPPPGFSPAGPGYLQDVNRHANYSPGHMNNGHGVHYDNPVYYEQGGFPAFASQIQMAPPQMQGRYHSPSHGEFQSGPQGEGPMNGPGRSDYR